MKERLSDYIMRTLADRGARHLFLVTGGGAMHLNDAIGKEERLRYICNHHEQAAAMAAEGYARVSGRVGLVNVTAGPGAINALNGVFGAFTDSVPMLVLSGQVKRETMLATHGLSGRLRQLGDQEVDIVGMVRGITKMAVTVTEPETIRYHLERALHLASHGRPGPCWIDLPVDVQGSLIEPETLLGYNPVEDLLSTDDKQLGQLCEQVAERLATAERPVLMVGTGVRIAKAEEILQSLAARLGIPVVTAWTHDTIPSSHRCFCGRPGSIGDRPGNFAVQNSDLLIVIGSRLNVRQVSYNWSSFARHAFKVQVDIDQAELEKPMVRPDLPICADAGAFLKALDAGTAEMPGDRYSKWLAWCQERRQRYPVFDPVRQASKRGAINPYHFATQLWDELSEGDLVVCGDATATIATFQCAQIKAGQRLISNSGCASMGHDLPAAIGAAVAADGKRVICLAGDGSLQMNIQELQTVVHHQLPIKLFVLNNGGYLSIRQTQTNFFGRQVGATPESGVSFPDAVAVARAYGLPAERMEEVAFRAQLRGILEREGPVVCEVMLDRTQSFEPKLTSRKLADGRLVSSPLEDMAPFLSREELAENMLVPLVEEPQG